jgi:23S rRNA (cytidine1920-2'-O)/16S rRNA (cytidine1409-2'-O)-methyltransferase
MSARERADRLLVARGLFDSRAKAQAAIAAGLVTADDRPVHKPSDEIACEARLAAAPAFPWVSRGGIKLAHALDVLAHDQLHPRLRVRPEIASIEKTDIRALGPALVTPAPEIVVVDVSFISLKLVLPAALALAAPRATLVTLVKPQFEAPRRHRKRGVVRDAATHAAVCQDIAGFIATLGCRVIATLPSPIEGGEGNREFFIGAQRG